jgi:hypothetical protein
VHAKTALIVGHVEVSRDLPRGVAKPYSGQLEFLAMVWCGIPTYMKPPILATRPRKTATKVTFCSDANRSLLLVCSGPARTEDFFSIWVVSSVHRFV